MDQQQATGNGEPANEAQDFVANPAKKQKLSKKQRRKTRQQRYKEKFPKPDYAPIVKNNENYNKYYTVQTFFEEGEFENEFIKTLQETLPASFRINAFEQDQARFLRHLIEHGGYKDLLSPLTTDKNGDQLTNDESKQTVDECSIATTALQPLSWYPKKLGWQMNISRVDLRNNAILKELHKFIMAETENGFISRQEAVSMIPPLLLDVHRGQDILDMCAAPGSKTAQLLEYLAFDVMDTGENEKNKSKFAFDDGMVVANDVDNKRCYMLVHQSSRLNSPNCIIINQDASRLPNIKTISRDSQNENKFTNLKFDRILCDVPCSGDGTMRKNPDVWKKWSVGNANNFHGMQCKILKRGLEMLKENGLLVYSTCSLNPVEDEAVIASILRSSEGSVELDDVAHKVPTLKYRPGVNKWTVMSKEMEPIPKPESLSADQSASHIYPSLFEPSEEESKTFNLNKCLRILPHFQNTGGFFVAVLKKLTPRLPWEDPEKDDEVRVYQPINPKKRRFTGFKEDPFYFMDANDQDWINLKKVYKIDDNFPVEQLVHRSGTEGKKRTIYLVSKKVKEFVIANREEPDRKDFVKIINCGMKLFHRAETEAGFRICQDGVAEILPYIKDDIKVTINKQDLTSLLKSRSVTFDVMSAKEQLVERIKPGSFIMIYKYLDPENQEPQEMPLVSWKGEKTVTLYVSNTYRTHLCALAQLKIKEDYAANEKKQPPAQQQQQKKTIETDKESVNEQ